MRVASLGLVAVGVLGAAAGAPAGADEPASDPTHRFAATAEVGPELLWNPFDLTPGSLSKLRRDRAADRTSGRFDDVESETDVALRAAVEGRWRYTPTGGRALRTWVGLDHRQFLVSARGSYLTVTAGAKQSLGETTFVRVDLEGVPARFDANRLAGADDSDGNGSISDSERRYRGLWSDTGDARATFGWGFGDAKPFHSAEVFVGVGAERFRTPFGGRGGGTLATGIAAIYHAEHGATTRFGYAFGAYLDRAHREFMLLDEDDYSVDLNGDGDQADKDVGVVRDTDYSRLDHEIALRWRSPEKAVFGGGFDVALRVRQWTSGEAFDARHEERLDARLQMGFHLAFRLGANASLEIGVQGEVEGRNYGTGAVNSGAELDHGSGRAFGRVAMEF